MLRVATLLKSSQQYLKARQIASFQEDAEILLAHVLGCQRLDLYLEPDRPVPAELHAKFQHLLEQRAHHCPVAYLTGTQGFMSLSFQVNSNVLIPRPETEHLVERALELMRERVCQVLDLGTGSGNIVIALAKYHPHAQFTATDISLAALTLARQNAQKHGVAERISWRQGDLWEAVPPHLFDLIVANPPYIAAGEFPQLMPDVRDYEPAPALLAGDGYVFFRRILAQVQHYLTPAGSLLMEMGAGQHTRLIAMAASYFQHYRIISDYAGIARVIELSGIRTSQDVAQIERYSPDS